MKKNSAPQEAKYFKYQLSKKMILLAVLALLLSVVGIGLSVYRIVKNGVIEFSDVLKSPLLILVCLFCIAVVVSILVKSQYVIDKKNYTTQFGFIKSSFAIKDITSIVLDTATSKLTVYVGEQYSVLSLSPEWNNDFIQALREVNPNIDFSFTQ